MGSIPSPALGLPDVRVIRRGPLAITFCAPRGNWDVECLAPSVVLSTCTGALTAPQTRAALAEIERHFTADRPLEHFMDARAVAGHDREVRALALDWVVKHRSRIAVAFVLTDDPLLRMLVSTMSLASGGAVRTLRSLAELQTELAARGANV